MKPVIYPNSWYVSRESDGLWWPVTGSFGNKSYATGWIHGLNSSYPCPKYRLINPKGEVIEEYAANGTPHTNSCR